MGWDAWFALGVVGLVTGLLILTQIGPDLILLGGLTLLLLSGVLSVEDALAGFSNPGLATVGILYVVVAGVQDTGGVRALGTILLGRPRSVAEAQVRLVLPVMTISAFLNNTPLVAMFIPIVHDWARRYRIAASKLMIPLSYAAILGGTCTLVGTSTNLVVHGLVLSQTDLAPLGFFEIAWVGAPGAVRGAAFILATGRWLLPERRPPISEVDDPRKYAVEMLVEHQGPLVLKTIEEAGLWHLPGMYLAEIERGGSIMPAVAPTERLRGGDRLVFVGIVESVVYLYKIKGLIPAPDQVFKLDAPRDERCLIEAVVSSNCPVVGRTIRDGRFRSRYQAVVIAVARNGERVPGKIGDIGLYAGDTLLLEALPGFVEQQRNSRDFLLVSAVEDSAPPRHERAGIALAVTGGMIGLVALGWLPMLNAALLAAVLMAAAQALGVSFRPFVITIMMAASADFATPIGYQTNLMVYGPGGYRFTDYLRVGIPLDLLFMAVTVALTPLVFPFYP